MMLAKLNNSKCISWEHHRYGLNCVASLVVILMTLISHLTTPIDSMMLFEYYDFVCIIQYAIYGSIIASMVIDIHNQKNNSITLYHWSYALMIAFNIILIILQQIPGEPVDADSEPLKISIYHVCILPICITATLNLIPQCDEPWLNASIVIYLIWHMVNWCCIVQQYKLGCVVEGIPTFIAFMVQYFFMEPHRIRHDTHLGGAGFLCIYLSSLLCNKHIGFAIQMHTVGAIGWSPYLLKRFKGIWLTAQDPQINLDDFVPPLNGQRPLLYFFGAKIHDGIFRILHCMLYLFQESAVPNSSGLRCDNCGVSFEMLRMCKRCKNVRYCSRECQKISWKYIHRYQCKIPVK